MSHRLEIKDLTVSYNRVPAVHHLNLDLACGTCVALVGPNGAGKTTLLKTLAGLLQPETGTIRLHGRDLRGLRQDMAYLPQRENVDWDFPVTVRGLADMGRYGRVGWWRKFSEADKAATETALHALNLADIADRQINSLSGGQQQRSFLARALAQEAHVLLLDEPFTGLDKTAQESFGKTLRSLAGQHKLLLVSHHDLRTVPDFFDEVVLLNGELVAHGKVAAAFVPANIDKTFGTAVFSGVHA
jgi:ABC-type Mn2+/Zn2+ transport system ATPase subunit